jgi:hypothetical protein
MSAITNKPRNKNFLSPLNFSFVLKRSPHLNFFCQKVNLPGIVLSFLDQPSPLLTLPVTANHPTFNDLNVTFKVDEDLQNYLEIFSWIKGLGYFQTNQDYKNLSSVNTATGQTVKSDISLVIGDGIKNPNWEIVFHDAFPSALGDLEFDTTDTSVDYITTNVTFKYNYYDIINI